MKRHSLLFGIQNYPGTGELTPLKCPHADVDALAEVFSDPRFMGEVGQVLVCKDQTLPEARQSFREFFRNLGREDVAIIHFSGHGLRDDAGDLYLCFTDTDEDDLAMTGLDVTRLGDWMAKKRLRRTLITLDCCYSAAAGAQMTRDTVAAQLRAAERPMSDGTGLYILSASGDRETAKEGERLGVFTHHLIRGIRTGEADTNDDGEITVSEIAEYLQREVPKDAARQSPHLTAHKVSGTFVVARNPVAIEAERAREAAERAAEQARVFSELSGSVAARLRDHENVGAISMVFAGSVQAWLDAHPPGEDHPRLELLRRYAAGRLSAVDLHERWRATEATPEPDPEPARAQPWGASPVERAAARAAAAAEAGPGLDEAAVRFHGAAPRGTGATAETEHATRGAGAAAVSPAAEPRPGFFRRTWKVVAALVYAGFVFLGIASEGGSAGEALSIAAISFGFMWLLLAGIAWIVRTLRAFASRLARK